MDTPDEKTLKLMPYSQLKKYARNFGIKKRNVKAEDLISRILAKKQDDDSFVALEQKIINSCKKRKQEKFDTDKKVDCESPRRGTYILDSPFMDGTAVTEELIASSASPALKKPSDVNETSLNVTMSRGSERKTKKRKVSFVTPMRRSMRLSVLTPQYASVKDRPKTPIPSRVSSGRRNVLRQSFSRSSDLKNKSLDISGGSKVKRPSTPLPSSKHKRMNLSSAGLEKLFATPISTPDKPGTTQPSSKVKDSQKVVSFSTPALPSAKKLTKGKSSKKNTPHKEESGVKSASKAFPETTGAQGAAATPSKIQGAAATPSKVQRAAATPSTVQGAAATPKGSGVKNTAKNIASVGKRVQVSATPKESGVKNAAKNTTSVGKRVQESATPIGAGMKNTPNALSASTKAKGAAATPNFNKIHQKAFAKMESIDEYKRRKDANSAKKIKEQSNIAKKIMLKKTSKIPKTFGGIPFIPSVMSTKDIKTNFASISRAKTNVIKEKKAVKSLTFIERSLSKKASSEVNADNEKKVKAVSRENSPLKRKTKFDLQASLSKKLPYKPHTGPLKPLAETSLNSTFHGISNPTQKTDSKNELVKAKRIETRGILRGVRKNRRFELQMKNRTIA